MRNFRDQQGYTLVEVLVAIGIFSLVAVSVASVFGNTIEAYRRCYTTLQRSTQRLRLQERIERDLNNVVPYSADGFHGSTQQLTLVSLLPASSNEGPARSRHHFLRYVLDENDPRVLYRIASLPGIRPADTTVLAHSVKRIVFQYARLESGRQLTWQSSWSVNETPVLPVAIKFSITLVSPGQDDGEKLNIERTYYLRLGGNEETSENLR